MRQPFKPRHFRCQGLLFRSARQVLAVACLQPEPDARRQAEHRFELERGIRGNRFLPGEQAIDVLGGKAETLREFRLGQAGGVAMLIQHRAGRHCVVGLVVLLAIHGYRRFQG